MTAEDLAKISIKKHEDYYPAPQSGTRDMNKNNVLLERRYVPVSGIRVHTFRGPQEYMK